jgi:hypothetical protein
MIASRATGLTLAAAMVVSSACARENATPSTREFGFGGRRFQVVVPAGWEALDQGKQKRFRKGESEVVLQDLGARTPPPRDQDELIDWGLAAVGHDHRREEKSRLAVMLDGREAIDIETWNRLDHTNPQRIRFVNDEGDLLEPKTWSASTFMRSRGVRLLVKRQVLPPSSVRPTRPPTMSKPPPAIQPRSASVNQMSRKSAEVPSGNASQAGALLQLAAMSSTQAAKRRRFTVTQVTLPYGRRS